MKTEASISKKKKCSKEHGASLKGRNKQGRPTPRVCWRVLRKLTTPGATTSVLKSIQKGVAPYGNHFLARIIFTLPLHSRFCAALPTTRLTILNPRPCFNRH